LDIYSYQDSVQLSQFGGLALHRASLPGSHPIIHIWKLLAFGGLYLLIRVPLKAIIISIVIIVAIIIQFWILLWVSSRSADLWLQDLSTI